LWYSSSPASPVDFGSQWITHPCRFLGIFLFILCLNPCLAIGWTLTNAL